MSDPSVAPGRSLIDLIADAGAAVDRAQVACDLLAHRIVDVVATTDPGPSPDAHDALRATAGGCGELARDVTLLTRRYLELRGHHLDAHDAFDAAMPAQVASAFDELGRTGTAIEDAAIVLGRAVDAAERRLRSRPAHGGSRSRRERPDPPLGTSSSDDVLLN